MISENFVPVAGYRPAELAWSATDIAILTGGRWVVPPSDSAGWKMTGLCATPPPSHTTTTTTQINACQHLMLLASTGEVGLSLHQIERLCTKAAGIISQAGGEHDYVSYGAPLLEVVNLRQAVTDLAAAARRQFQGTVIGVTGSVGKTSTVAMIGHALAGVGKCDRSRTSANGFYAIGWNLASMDRGADFWVQEMSVHNMDICSRLVRPDAAIITAIAPAHLADFRNTETVARFKARIYNGMTPGAIVVINGDMDEFGVIEPLARAAGLRVVRFGAHESSHAQFLSMDRATVHAKILGKTCSFKIGRAHV
jgi:UDP-N-acetylmuramyl pentapeptide synthase